MKLSANFTMEEMIFSETAKRRNIPNLPDAKQTEKLQKLCNDILQPIRDKWNGPLKVNSGFRSYVLNKMIGGVSSSQHLRGEAADIMAMRTKNQNIVTFSKKELNRKLFEIIQEMIKNNEIAVGQLIDEKNYSWIHVSLPDGRHLNQILHL